MELTQGRSVVCELWVAVCDFFLNRRISACALHADRSNKEFPMMKCGIASLCLLSIIKNDRIPHFDIHNSLFDIRYSSKGSFDGIEIY